MGVRAVVTPAAFAPSAQMRSPLRAGPNPARAVACASGGQETGQMTRSAVVRVAAVQATPVILDVAATIDKAVALLGQAAAEGARLAVLPEAFVSLYPSNAWAAGATRFSGWDELWERMWDSAVDVRGPHVARLVDACREHRVHCVVGVNEREDERPGSLYNTMLLLGPE